MRRGVATVAAAALLVAAPSRAEDCPDLAWERLRLGVSKFLVVRGSVEVRARAVAAGAVKLTAPEDLVALEPGDGCVVVVEGRADSSVTRPVRTRETLDASTGGVLQQEQERARRTLKVRRFGAGASVAHVGPPEPTDGFGPGILQRVERVDREPWPAQLVAGLPVTAGHALLYQVAADRLDRAGARRSYALLTHGRLVRLDLTAGETVERTVSHVLVQADGTELRGRRSTVARRVAVAVVPLDGDEAGVADVDVLGMKGGVEIQVEVGTGLPLVVAGEVEAIGHVEIELDEAELSAKAAVAVAG